VQVAQTLPTVVSSPLNERSMFMLECVAMLAEASVNGGAAMGKRALNQSANRPDWFYNTYLTKFKDDADGVQQKGGTV